MAESAKMFGPMMQHMYATMGALGKAFYEKYGDDALPIITEVMGETGAAGGKLAKGMLKGEGMKAMGEMFGMFSMLGFDFQMIEVSDDTLHFKSSKCPLCVEGTSRGLCEAMMSSDKQMISTIIGEEVDMEIPKSLAVGDEYCEVIFKTK